MNKKHLFWIAPLIMILSILSYSAFVFDADQKTFSLGATWACYDGCYNMIEVYETNISRPYGDQIKVKYDFCTTRCNAQYFDKTFQKK